MFGIIPASNSSLLKLYFGDTLDSRSGYYQDAGSYTPHCTISKSDRGYSLAVEMPGLSRSDIEVSVLDGALTVRGVRELKESKVTYSRSWTLGDNVVEEGISARYDAGILYVEVPVQKTTKRVISVE